MRGQGPVETDGVEGAPFWGIRGNIVKPTVLTRNWGGERKKQGPGRGE